VIDVSDVPVEKLCKLKMTPAQNCAWLFNKSFFIFFSNKKIYS